VKLISAGRVNFLRFNAACQSGGGRRFSHHDAGAAARPPSPPMGSFQNAMQHCVLRCGHGRTPRPRNHFPQNFRHILRIRLAVSSGIEFAVAFLMKIWKSASLDRVELPHEFIIGPARPASGFPPSARLYYCRRCEESYVVSGRRVAVLDASGSPLSTTQSRAQYDAFAENRCPAVTDSAALEPSAGPRRLALVAPRAVSESRVARAERDEPSAGRLAASLRHSRGI